LITLQRPKPQVVTDAIVDYYSTITQTYTAVHAPSQEQTFCEVAREKVRAFSTYRWLNKRFYIGSNTSINAVASGGACIRRQVMMLSGCAVELPFPTLYRVANALWSV
jgi:selenocysteine lyase/cysteine desulfurase